MERQEGRLASVLTHGETLFLILDDGTEVPLPKERECPDGLLVRGARVVETHAASPARTVSIDGFVVWCVDDAGRVGHVDQRPAVLGGPPIVRFPDGPPPGSSLERFAGWLPGAEVALTAIGELKRAIRAGIDVQLPLLEMLELNRPQLPFEMAPVHVRGIGDTRLHYNDEWGLSAAVVRRWLTVELAVEFDDAEPRDRSIQLPRSFFARRYAIRLLELALLKLHHWKADPGVLEWAKGLEPSPRPEA